MMYLFYMGPLLWLWLALTPIGISGSIYCENQTPGEFSSLGFLLRAKF